MKKLLLITAVIGVLLAGVWLGAVWLAGQQTEQRVRQYFEQDDTHELVSYRRTFFGATALTRHQVSQTLLGNWFDVIPLQHTITHGPLKVQLPSKQLQTGWSFWQTRLVTDMLDEEAQQWLQAAFSQQPPLSGSLHVDLEQTARYQLALAPLNIESPLDELTVSLEGLQLEGQFNPADPKQFFSIFVQQLVLENREVRMLLPELLIRRLVATAPPAAEQSIEYTWEAEQVSALFNHAPQPIRFAVSGQAAIQTQANQLSGAVSVNLGQFSGLDYPLQNAEFSVDYAGLNAVAVAEIDRLQNRMQDLQAQLNWQAKDVELPEGRRQLFQLDVQLEETADQLLQVLFKQVLQPEQSQLNTRLRLNTPAGDVNGNAALSYAGTEQPFNFERLTQAGLADWLQLLRGDVELTLAKAALPDDLELLLFYPLQQQGLAETGNGYRLKLRLLAGNAVLNGRVVAYDELAERFLPLATETGAEVPEDVWQMIEKRGFSEEILQELERRDDVPPATLEMLRELQQMSQ